MSKFSSEDLEWMRRAITEAKKNLQVSPNPPVGAILVKNRKIVGVGHHRGPGFAHAEIEAIHNASQSIAGSTLYVTLEPCCHTNKRTPPCVPQIIAAGISRVVVGEIDPNPEVNGKGIRILKRNRFKVEVGCLTEECHALTRFYKKWAQTKIPYVLLKAASTLDGKIATGSGESKWISSEASRKKTHELRAQVDAILVGSHTILKDDPELTVRHVHGRNPTRIILDSSLKLPLSKKIFQTASRIQTILVVKKDQRNSPRILEFQKKGVKFIFCKSSRDKRIDLQDLLSQLGKLEITSVLVEGGGETLSSFVRQRLWDEFHLFLAPRFLGGEGKDLLKALKIQRLKEAIPLKFDTFEKVGEDLAIRLYPRGSWSAL